MVDLIGALSGRDPVLVAPRIQREHPGMRGVPTQAPTERLQSGLGAWRRMRLLLTAAVVAALVSGCGKPGFLDRNEFPRPAIAEAWTMDGLQIEGRFADPDVAVLADGSLRMYAQHLPGGRGHGTHSFRSADGTTWTEEAGDRVSQGAFPDVVRLEDGSWRLYRQVDGAIVSATSADGLEWVEEPGVRLGRGEPGQPDGEQVADAGVVQHAGQWLMVYRGDSQDRYDDGENRPSNPNSTLMWATSGDGLTFTKRGPVFSSQTKEFRGWAAGPDTSVRDGEVHAYFWSFHCTYRTILRSGSWTSPECVMYEPPGPAGAREVLRDPTLASYAGSWRMWGGWSPDGEMDGDGEGIGRATLG